jgi:hypothetical protein
MSCTYKLLLNPPGTDRVKKNKNMGIISKAKAIYFIKGDL